MMGPTYQMHNAPTLPGPWFEMLSLKPELHKLPGQEIANLAGDQSVFTSDANAWRGFRSNRSRG
jgi:hypothetical protein